MVSAKDVINSTKSKPIKLPKGDTQLGSAGYDNIRDDIEKTKSLREGSIEKVPVNDNDIANKKYVDDNAGNEYTAGTGLTLTLLEFSTNDIEIDHDELLNYIANEHIDWTNATNNLLTTGTLKGSNFETTSNGTKAGYNVGDIQLSTTFIGKEAGLYNTAGYNTFVGNSAGRDISPTTSYQSSRNTFIGASSGSYARYGDHMAAIGYAAASFARGDDLTAMGYESGKYCLGDSCSFLGSSAGDHCEGDRSIGIGFQSAKDNDGHNCVLIGHEAGEGNTTNNQFILKHSTANATPLIQGDFSTGDINIPGYISGKKAGVFAYLTEAANTTITTAGTYYPIAGTFTNAPIEDFGAATTYTPGIKYLGTKTQYFEIDWHAAGYGDAAGQTIRMGIKKNGVLCTGSVMGTFLKFLNEEQALSGTCVIELATNDEIQLVITSDSNGDVITLEHFTTTITEFFD